MSQFSFSARSLKRLQGVHPQLVRVVKQALVITDIDFTVVCGLRTEAEQVSLVHAGKSWTMNSRHLTGHAVDLAPWIEGKIPWHDKDPFDYLAKIMFRAAHLTGEVVEWGGHFGTVVHPLEDAEPTYLSKYDGPHFQLPWQMFPAEDTAA